MFYFMENDFTPSWSPACRALNPFQDVLAPFTLPTCVTLIFLLSCDSDLIFDSDSVSSSNYTQSHPYKPDLGRAGDSHTAGQRIWMNSDDLACFYLSLCIKGKSDFFKAISVWIRIQCDCDVTLDGHLACSLNTASVPLKNKTICLGLKQPD